MGSKTNQEIKALQIQEIADMKSRGKFSKGTFGWVLLAALFIVGSNAFARQPATYKKGQKIYRTAGTPNLTLLNGNNITSWIESNAFYPANVAQSWNGEFPRGSGVGFIYQEGIVIAGLVNDGSLPILRAEGSTYATSMQAGAIVQNASDITTGVDNPDAPDVRIWRVRSDVYPGESQNSIPDLTIDAATFNQIPTSSVTPAQIAATVEQYQTDWSQWPADKGAPWYVDTVGVLQYNDANHTFDPSNPHDIPGVPGATETVWFVCNDINSQSTALLGSPPTGIEEQQTVWDYATSTPLNNIYFKQVKMIYKGTATSNANSEIDSAYVVQWRDPDNGYYGDDYAGSDSTLALGFVYNGEPTDSKYTPLGLAPPASGGCFLQGPAHFTGDPNDSAVIDFQWRHGYKYWYQTNQQPYGGYPTTALTAYDYFAAGSQQLNDPNWGYSDGAGEFYNLCRGDLPYSPVWPATGTPVYTASTYASAHGIVTSYALPGDPVTHTGWVDGYDISASDRRDMEVSGPFTLKLHDTIEVVTAMIGGLGVNYLSSVSVLKYNATFAHYAFDNLFKLPSAPPPPHVVATALNDTVVLDWGSDQKSLTAIENNSGGGFSFEGYNVYQFPSASSSTSDAVRIATYDKQDGILTVLSPEIDPSTGVVIKKPVEFGSDSGIKRVITLTQDMIRNQPLVDGQTYYYAVTAYSVNLDPNAPFSALESAPVILTVTPHSPNPGITYGAITGDTLKTVDHIAGTSDGVIYPVVVDPTALTGHTYKITFSNSPTGLVWNLSDSTANKTLVTDNSDFAGDNLYPIVDGVMVKVQGPPPQIKSAPGSAADGFVETAYAGTPLTSSQYDAAGKPFHGNKVWHSLNSNATYYVSAGGGDGNLDRMLRGDDPQNAAGNNFKLEWVDPSGPNWGMWYFDNGQIAKVPFALWKYNITTGDSERLIPVLYSGGASPANAGTFEYKNTDPYFGYPATDWIYWYSDTTQADAYKGQTGYAGFAAACAAGDTAAADNFGMTEYFGRMIICDFAGTGKLPPTGTVDMIYMTSPITASDVYTFTTPAPTQSTSLAKADVQKVNVFPNPYYGWQYRETNALNKQVTFNHLPQVATIRIYNLAGTLVKTIYKNDNTQFAIWNLRNESDLPVASGIYIIDVDMGKLGTKILKFAMVQQQQVLPAY